MIAQPRLRRVVRHDIDGHIPVDGLELRENGLQDRIVAGVALAVGTADEHAGFFLLRLRGSAQDGLVDLDLLADGRVDGEFVRGFFVEILAQLLAHGARFGQPRHARAERLRVLRLKEQTGHAVLDDIRDAADIRRDGRAAHARAFGDGVGEGLGDGRERVDVERVVKTVHIRDPAREHDRTRRAGLRGKRFEHLVLLALACDQQADIRMIFDGDGKAADERRHILDRVEPRGDAEDDGIVLHLQANRAQIVLPPELRRDRGKIDAVVIDVQPAQSFVKTNSELMILNEEFVTEDYAMCISKNKPELKASINEALNVIKANGTLDKIIDNYIGEDYMDVLADGCWEKYFTEKPPVFTKEEKQKWLSEYAKDVTLGSDAFFPFDDNIDRAYRSGVKYIAQPGGSIRDKDCIDACNRHNMVMSFTGIRLFHH